MTVDILKAWLSGMIEDHGDKRHVVVVDTRIAATKYEVSSVYLDSTGVICIVTGRQASECDKRPHGE